MILTCEKADQAQNLLDETGLDCWLTFVRETGIHPDPGIELVVGTEVTWISAFLFSRSGRRIAIVGRFDVTNIENTRVYDEVIGYDEGIRKPLLEVLSRLDPEQIGLNYSTDDPTADGLTHGLWELLTSTLRDTPYAARLTSAAPLLARLRARKSPTEIRGIRTAIATTEEIFAGLGHYIRPGQSEKQIADWVHEQVHERGVTTAWEWDACPIVNSGPESDAGHAKPRTDIVVEPGHLVHVDLGIKEDGFCSDLQRMWYVRRPGEAAPPVAIQKAFAVVLAAIEAGEAALKPGVRGHEVDAAARQLLVANGYPEFKHALGHGLGRACHDGGTLLGPRWEKYGRTPEGIVEPGNVFTLELGVNTEAGYIGLEEDVVVTEAGCEYLSMGQKTLMLL